MDDRIIRETYSVARNGIIIIPICRRDRGYLHIPLETRRVQRNKAMTSCHRRLEKRESGVGTETERQARGDIPSPTMTSFLRI